MTYPWILVSNYDQRFRELVHRNPTRHWGVISYDDFYKEILSPFGATSEAVSNKDAQSVASSSNHNGGKGRIKKRACWAYNKYGTCKFKDDCKFEHRCTNCGKLGHPECKCRSRRSSKGHSGSRH